MLKVNEHENIITELTKLLSVEGIDSASISLKLQQLRENYNEVNTSLSNSDKTINEIKLKNEGLLNANMTLITKLSGQADEFKNPDIKETTPDDGTHTDDVLSTDDIIAELMK